MKYDALELSEEISSGSLRLVMEVSAHFLWSGHCVMQSQMSERIKLIIVNEGNSPSR